MTDFSIFEYRKHLVDRYHEFSRSAVTIRASDIQSVIDREQGEDANGLFSLEPLIQISPSYRQDLSIAEMVREGSLHPDCLDIFRSNSPTGFTLFQHQSAAIHQAKQGNSFVVTTGTGSGKSLCFFLPIIDSILQAKEKGEK